MTLLPNTTIVRMAIVTRQPGHNITQVANVADDVIGTALKVEKLVMIFDFPSTTVGSFGTLLKQGWTGCH